MTWKNFSRRQFAKHLTILGGLPLGVRSLPAVSEVAHSKPPAPPDVKSYPGILKHRVVFWDPYGYSAWPTILRCRDGEMLIAFCEAMRRAARLTHADPSFYGMIIRSGDQGETWSEHPEVIGGYEYYGMDDPGIWSTPAKTPMWGYPAHLRQLRDGRLLASYGHRRKPFGIRACLSSDEGRTWDIENEIVLRDDLKNRDPGYPTTTQLDDGTLLTAYYGRDENNDVTCIQITSWNVVS